MNECKISTAATDPASVGDHEAKLVLIAVFFHHLFYNPLTSASTLAGGEYWLGGMTQTFISTGFTARWSCLFIALP